MAILQNIATWCIEVGLKVLVAIVLLIVGWKLTNKIAEKIRKNQKANKLDHTTAQFVANIANWGMKILLVVICVSIMGIPVASVVTVLATAGAAIALALQGGLSNIAGGVLIMLYKPFKIGDYITCDGESGTVEDISIFYTKLLTVDNKEVMLPNGTVAGCKVVNVTAKDVRRVDFEYTVNYDTSVDGVLALLKNIGASHELTLEDSQVDTFVGGYNEKGITVYLRTWCKTEDYWTVYFDINKTVHDEFARFDVKFAIPQVAVHSDKK